MAVKPKTLTELKFFIALYANIQWNSDQIANISVLREIISSGSFYWNLELDNAFDGLIKYWPNFPEKRPRKIWKHFQPITPITKEIANHNFMKIANKLIAILYRGYNQELIEEYLNSIRYALSAGNLSYAHLILVEFSNLLLRKRNKYHSTDNVH